MNERLQGHSVSEDSRMEEGPSLSLSSLLRAPLFYLLVLFCFDRGDIYTACLSRPLSPSFRPWSVYVVVVARAC